MQLGKITMRLCETRLCSFRDSAPLLRKAILVLRNARLLIAILSVVWNAIFFAVYKVLVLIEEVRC